MKWNTNMDEAPRDGTAIQARIPGHGEDNIIAWDEAYIDSANRPCGSWTYVEDREPPEDWTDGVCWEVNEDGKPSTQPTAWTHLPPPPDASTGDSEDDSTMIVLRQPSTPDGTEGE